MAEYKKIITQDPTHCMANISLGKIYHTLHQYDNAQHHLFRALENRTSENEHTLALANALLHLGNSFFDAHETEKALSTFKKILTLSDTIGPVHHNIAFTLAEQAGDYQSSLAHYVKALAANPQSAETHFCYSFSLLATGDLIKGFQEYEWRWKRNAHAPRNFPTYPLLNQWDGVKSLAGKRVVINVEQGLGDTLMFIRYAQLLKEHGATVIAEVQKPLVSLLSLCVFIDEIIPIGVQLPPHDYQIPMLNLPVVFNTTITTIPARIPYLRADPSLVSAWKLHLATDSNVKIGVCWRGDPTHGDNKFMPFNYFAQLTQVPGVSIYSLQKLEGTSTNKAAPFAQNSRIKQFEADFDETNGRFMDTAAVMKNLDLIITVDTSIAHLAGGLGVPTWLVLPYPAEWRWLMHRHDSPWYPTMRLFRQQKFGDWQSVFDQLVSALQQVIQKGKKSGKIRNFLTGDLWPNLLIGFSSPFNPAFAGGYGGQAGVYSGACPRIREDGKYKLTPRPAGT